jgi:hypothetical protein
MKLQPLIPGVILICFLAACATVALKTGLPEETGP